MQEFTLHQKVCLQQSSISKKYINRLSKNRNVKVKNNLDNSDVIIAANSVIYLSIMFHIHEIRRKHITDMEGIKKNIQMYENKQLRLKKYKKD